MENIHETCVFITENVFYVCSKKICTKQTMFKYILEVWLKL